MTYMLRRRSPAPNTGFVQLGLDGILKNICAKLNICTSNPALRKAVEHYMQFYRTDRTDFNRRDFRNNYVYNLEFLETIE